MAARKAPNDLEKQLRQKARRMGIVGFRGSGNTTNEEHLRNLELIEADTAEQKERSVAYLAKVLPGRAKKSKGNRRTAMKQPPKCRKK